LVIECCFGHHKIFVTQHCFGQHMVLNNQMTQI
jgi:hypothetical protein